MAEPGNRVRVLEVVAWNSTRGGAEKHVVDLLRTLPRDEFELALASSPGGNLSGIAASRGVPWFRAPLLRARPDQGFRGIRSAIRAFQPHLIHAHGNRAMLNTILVDRRSAKRLIYTHHGIALVQASPRRARVQTPVERLAAGRVARHITVSAADLETAASRHLVKLDRAIVVHNGVEPVPAADGAAFREQLHLPGDALVVLCVARFQPVKDHANLLRAWPSVLAANPRARLLLVGRGREMESAAALAASLGVEASVTFAGGLDDVSPAYAAADLQVLPSRGEGLPYALLEGMSVGLPIVATRVGGVPECVEHDVTGLLVPPSNPQALAEALSLLLSDEPRRTLMSARAKSASMAFTLDRMAAQVAEVYREVASGTGSATWKSPLTRP